MINVIIIATIVAVLIGFFNNSDELLSIYETMYSKEEQ